MRQTIAVSCCVLVIAMFVRSTMALFRLQSALKDDRRATPRECRGLCCEIFDFPSR
jgi:hypothetical protein